MARKGITTYLQAPPYGGRRKWALRRHDEDDADAGISLCGERAC